jgi:hypothetical protein
VATSADVGVSVGSIPAGTLHVAPGFGEVSLPLPPEAVRALSGPDPVRLSFHTPTTVPKDAGASQDTRALGIGIDRISLE